MPRRWLGVNVELRNGTCLCDRHAALIDRGRPCHTIIKSDTIELVLQVNGKTRGVVVVPSGADKAAIEAAAAASPDVAKYGEGRAPKKIIVVPGRIINVVV